MNEDMNLNLENGTEKNIGKNEANLQNTDSEAMQISEDNVELQTESAEHDESDLEKEIIMPESGVYSLKEEKKTLMKTLLDKFFAYYKIGDYVDKEEFLELLEKDKVSAAKNYINTLFDYLLESDVLRYKDNRLFLKNTVQDIEFKNEFYEKIGEFKTSLESILDSKPTSFYHSRRSSFDKICGLIDELDEFLI